MSDTPADDGVPSRVEDGPKPDIGFTLGDIESHAGPDLRAPDADTDVDPASAGVFPAFAPEVPPDGGEMAPTGEPHTRTREVAYAVARQLAQAAPEGWTRLDAVFSMTVTDAFRRVFYTLSDETLVEAVPAESIVILAGAQRESVAELDGEPWWRMILGLREDGEITVDYDYGEEPFPPEQLLSPQAYLNDLAVFPRARLPLWLAAYIARDGRQMRPPERAVLQVELDRVAGARATPVDEEFPPLGIVWARWATLAAVFVATGSDRGPRILPSLGWFEGTARGGSTLFLIPGGRAVLSGGVWNAPEVEAAYNGLRDMPELYRGAPYWVANQVLNSRASQGTLSFCYWWDGTGWYRGDSPSPSAFTAAVPGIWTAETVVGIVAARFGAETDPSVRAAAGTLLAAAERAEVRREHLVDVLATNSESDLDGAYYQFCLAGLTAPEVSAMTEPPAEHRVPQAIAGTGSDSMPDPLAVLVSDRGNGDL
ncbi:hypothetical protein ABIA39_001635 [Nocardia sp. GAS34]|uniref:hypothetical protein n=1 Tax=unclassified Nocardia TaxID=2637762 RepID=UPI003D1DB0D1